MSAILSDKRVPPHEDPQDDRSASYAVRDGDSASEDSSHAKKLDVTEMKMCI